MTRKHYEAIARAISDAALINLTTPGEVAVSRDTRTRIAHEIADFCRRTNEAFDRNRFLAACGVES